MTTLTRQAVVEIFQAIQMIGRVSGPIAWTFAVASTRRAIQPIVDSIRESQVIPENLQEYQNERIKIATELSRPAAPGEAIPRDSIRIDDTEEFARRLKTLHVGKWEGAEDRIIAHFKDVDELLKQTVEVNITTCPMDKIPELPSQVVDALFCLIALPVDTKTAPK